MFLRESKQKRAGGAIVSHLQFAESVWNKATQRADTRIVYNFGRADDPQVRERLRALARSILRRVAPEEILAARPDWKLLDTWPYGDLYGLEQLWQHLGMPERLAALTRDDTRRTLPVERACFAMVANRCLAPASKLYLYEQWLREDVRVAGAEGLELHHLYRAMDFFERHKEPIEKELFFRIADLFACDVELIFYDTTTLHCEIDWEDAGGAEDVTLRGSPLAGAKSYPALRQRGKAKNRRDDVPQVIVGLAMTRDGLPVRSWVFRGDTVDVETIAQVKADLRGWKLTRSVFVGDAGMVSEANLRALAAGGGKYILCMPVKVGNEVSEAVLARPGRYHTVAPNLEVKEVGVGDGERRRRYVVCFNAEEAKRQQAHRAQLLAELEAALPTLGAEPPQPAGLCPPGQRAVREVSDPESARPPRDRPCQGAPGRTARRKVRRAFQRRHPDPGGPRPGLQAARSGGAGLAAPQERPADPPALPLGPAPHLRPCLPDHGELAPGAARRECLR